MTNGIDNEPREGERAVKHILLLSTGGTIACRSGESGLAPKLDGARLLGAVRVPARVRVTVRDLMCVDSADLDAAQRLAMARVLWEQRERYDGFVLTHGTDTMAYTAAFLCRVLPCFDRPVILTGSQLPMDAPGSDAPRNLADALACAASGYRGAAVCFGGKLWRGTCVTKAHAQAFDAFFGGNTGRGPDGVIEGGALTVRDMPEAGTPAWVQPMPVRAAVLAVTPLLDAETVLAYRGRDALLLYGYGVGGVPAALAGAVARVAASGTRVYLGTQCPEGWADTSVYAVGRRARALGVRCLGARTVEDAVACIQCGLL